MSNVEQNLIDPNYKLFYESCSFGSKPIFHYYYKYGNVDKYKNSRSYLEAVKKRYLKGFAFPSSVKFTDDNDLESSDPDSYTQICNHRSLLCNITDGSCNDCCGDDSNTSKWLCCNTKDMTGI